MAQAETLTTGWEPDVPVDDTVMRQFVFGYAERVAATATAAGGTVHRDDGVVIGDARSAFYFDNAMVLLQPPDDHHLADGIRRAKDTFRDRPWVLLSVWPTGDLRDKGMQLVGHPPLMLRPAGGTAPRHPAHLMIRRVTDGKGLEVFTRTLIEGYPMPAEAGTAAFHPSLLGNTVELLVGYVDGEPVATGGAAAIKAAKIAEIDWIAVRPEHRGKGYGAAMTWAAATLKPERAAVLIATDDGRPVYERLGFVALLRCTMWTGVQM
jgi:GNAT superfamily N-acetyltransferase